MKTIVFPVLMTIMLATGLSGVPEAAQDAMIVSPDNYSGVVSIRTIAGAGSGFVVGENKTSWYIATAAHVVDNGSNVPVDTLWVDGVIGEVVAYGNSLTQEDWAIVKVPRQAQRYRTYQLAETRQEARVRGVGYVYENGMENPLFVVYHGRVVTLDWYGFVAHNGGVFPGCSGGPLLDEWGRAVGITSQAPSAWGLPFETATLCVPVSRIQAALQTVLAEAMP